MTLPVRADYDDSRVLLPIEKEEADADKLLTQISERVNVQASA